ncbi:MAG: GNAT family N-acetyltransferase [Gaiella sp.]
MSAVAARTLRIRFATPEDDAVLAAIDEATWSPAISPAPAHPAEEGFFRPGIDPEDTLVAIRAETVVGYLLLGPPTPLQASAHVQMVRGLAVDPDAQRAGVGRALLDAAVEEASARGARKLSLRVLGSNGGARLLYETSGFEVEGVLRGEFQLDGRDVDDVLMARRLPRAAASVGVSSHVRGESAE